MSVFTKVSLEEARAWVKHYYSLGKVVQLDGIASGIENTNFFLHTDQDVFVLTLFEKLLPQELPFYLNLMAHLSTRGVPVPNPIKRLDGQYLGELNGKPAAIVSRIPGAPITEPSLNQIQLVGEQLAHLHLAGKSYEQHLDNLRGRAWWTSVSPEIHPFLNESDSDLLRSEIAYQVTFGMQDLPKGPIHADLFRDNVLFDASRVGGFIDFYFACIDFWVYDVAITANDWCVCPDGSMDHERLTALIGGYASVRLFTQEEAANWQTMLRAGALRFWVSRLYDYHLPRAGELTHAHDPEVVKRVLIHHRNTTPSVVLPTQ